MIKTAAVTLIQTSSHRTYVEKVTDYKDIHWEANHVVFLMSDDTLLAYRSDRIFELVTYLEEE